MSEREQEAAKTAEAKRALNLRHGKDAAKAAQKLRQQRIADTITLFKRVFPHTFKEIPMPLKCQINQDIVAYWQAYETKMDNLSNKQVRDTLQFYTSRLAYHKACLTENAMRIDLTGAVIEPVSEQAKIHHQSCVDAITTRHTKQAAQKKRPTKQQAATDTVTQGETTLGMQMPEMAITTDDNGNSVLTLKKKS